MLTTNNFKDYWLNFFSDSKAFKVDIEDDGIIEKLTITSPNPDNLAQIELLIFIDDRTYQQMFDIRFFHPNLGGYNTYQKDNEFGFDGVGDVFIEANIVRMEMLIEGFLVYGVKELKYFNGNLHYRSGITAYIEDEPIELKWVRSESAGLLGVIAPFSIMATINKRQELVEIGNWC